MLKVGDLIDGKYKILNEIGRGGMSTVYLAINEKANKPWAVKEVRKNGISNREDWRRDNVNVFIKECGEAIHRLKPWVKFGISPFGIYRNKRDGVEVGSLTKGTQNYEIGRASCRERV